MSLLHDFFHANDIRGFQRVLDGNDKKSTNTSGPSSGGRSWNRPSPLTGGGVDVNARDRLGRTILHIASTSIESINYLKLLLKHPNVNVNLDDTESQWTALHRALYNANILAASLLLKRSDIDVTLKDKEGYTPFDVYNSTIPGTKPDIGDKDSELFTWGANRNAALGLGDGNDRVHPDKVVLRPKDDLLETLPISTRFSKVHVRDIQMSKLHTAAITSENAGNLRLCGFGSGGRLGRGPQMQYDLNPLPLFTETIVAVALGQDHTLAVTKAGEVFSWGLNRFSQLGYVVEATAGKFDEPIQAVPKKILNPLRKEIVIGVAACKTASACWTTEDVYTWGTNHGQLGYDKHAHPTQIYPRKVTKFSQPVVAISLTDTMMACLLQSQQVECIWNDRHSRIIFPPHAFPSEIQPYRPPQALKASHIAKLAASDDLIAALSSNGEVFTFSSPSPSEVDTNTVIRPQRIWALRKKFSSVQDVAIGPDGSIITCTESGHVYLRIRNTKGGAKNFKFERIPYLQRITHVSANSTGAYAALRVDYKPKAIRVEGSTLAQDLGAIQPIYAAEDTIPDEEIKADIAESVDEDEEQEDADVERDIIQLRTLIRAWKCARGRNPDPTRLLHGADTLLWIASTSFSSHRVVLAARSKPLLGVFDGVNIASEGMSISLKSPIPGPGLGVTRVSVLKFEGINPLSILVLLHYLYSDEVLAIWDRRINVALASHRLGMRVDASLIKSDLQRLSRVLDLPALELVLQGPVKRIPPQSLPQHFSTLFKIAQGERDTIPEALLPDVLLEFADKDVWTHSTILRCRSLFFSGIFGSDVWTIRRWGSDGVLRLDFKHLRWHIMQFILRFMVCGEDKEMFEVLTFVKTADDVLEFLFEVMAPATELLLDRLLLLCSNIILKYLDIHNCCYILAEATHYRAAELVARVQEYMAANMESLLECGVLDNLPTDLLSQLSSFILKKQTEKSTFTRTPVYVDSMLAKHWDWLSEQDIPTLIDPSLRSAPREVKKRKLSFPPPRDTTKLVAGPHQLRQRASGDELFAMDDVPSSLQKERTMGTPKSNSDSAAGGPAWKVTNTPRVDMKVLMAEAQKSSRLIPLPPNGSPKYLAKKSSSEQRFPALEHSPSNHPPLQPSTPTKASARNTNSPWRAVGESSSSPSNAFPISLTQSISTNLPAAGPSSSGLSSTKPSVLSPSGAQIVLGPVITPTKQASKAATSIRNTSGKAWTTPPPEPVKPVEPNNKSALSFAAIQRAQEEQLSSGQDKDKRTLREIQQEEAELQQEADFLLWWGAEEERVRKEEQAVLEASRNQGQGSRRLKNVKTGGQGHSQGSEQGPEGISSPSKRKARGKTKQEPHVAGAAVPTPVKRSTKGVSVKAQQDMERKG